MQAALALLLGLSVLQAALPDGHPDPLYYDLLGPRLWAQAGRFYLPPSMPILLQCSSWDALGIWGQSLLGGDSGGGLVEGQLFMQWAHALLGGGGTALALERLLRPFAPRGLFRWTATLAAVCAGAMSWTLPFAKNDWGASFWLLCGAAILLEPRLLEPRARRELILGGALVGLGLIAKLTTLFTALPLLLLAALPGERPARERLRGLGLTAAAALLAMLPFLARNLAESGNPIFPSLDRLFHSPQLTESWRQYLAGFEGRFPETNPETLRLRAALFVKQSPLLFALPLLPLLGLLRRAWPAALPLWCASVASALLFLLGVGPDASLRLFGPGDLLLCGVSALSALALFDGPPLRLTRGLALALCAAIAALSLWLAHPPWLLPFQISSAPPIAELLRHQSPLLHYPPVGGLAKAFVRQHATRADRILSLEDDRLYYLSALEVVSVREDPELDRAFRALPLRRALEGSGATLLITTSDWRGLFRGQLDARLGPLLASRPQALLFEAEGAQVIDLRLLLQP